MNRKDLLTQLAALRGENETLRGRLAALQSDNASIYALLDHLREGIAIVDRHSAVLLVNRSALAMFGIQGDLAGKSVLELFRDVELTALLRGALASRQAETQHIRGGRTYQALFSPAGDGAMVLFLDITEKVGAEAMRRQFSANVSHELKTPLTGILGYAELLSSGMAQPEDAREFAGKIQSEAQQLIRLVEDILLLSQLDEAGTLPAPEPVELGGVAAAVTEALAAKSRKHGVRLRCEAPETWVQGNRTLLYELLYNLVDNAIKYNRSGGRACVAISREAGRAVVEVRDTGIGIAPEHQGRVLERFYRVDRSRSKKTGGTGLGLSIVKHIAAVHGGTVELQSQVGRGSVIKVTLGVPDSFSPQSGR